MGQLGFSYVLEAGVSPLSPANAVQSHVRGSVFPRGSKAGLGNL